MGYLKEFAGKEIEGEDSRVSPCVRFRGPLCGGFPVAGDT
jgi:hypothetical protein